MQVLPEILAEAGYFTVGISCNGLVSRTFGFGRGFRVFYEYHRGDPFKGLTVLPPNLTMLQKLVFIHKSQGFTKAPIDLAKRTINKIWRRLLPGVIENSTPFSLKAIDKTKHFIHRYAEEFPLFLFVNLMQCHAKYNPPQSVRGTFCRKKMQYPRLKPAQYYALKGIDSELAAHLRDLYDEELLYADRLVGEIYEFLSQKNLLEETILVITSDHGELLGEHGGLLDHHYSLYDELCRVPLIIRFPRSLNIYGIDNKIVQLTDLFSTLCDVVGLPFPSPWSSHSLLSSNRRNVAILEDMDAPFKLRLWKTQDPDFPTENYPYRYPLLGISNSVLKVVGTVTESNAQITDVYLREGRFEEEVRFTEGRENSANSQELKDKWVRQSEIMKEAVLQAARKSGSREWTPFVC